MSGLKNLGALRTFFKNEVPTIIEQSAKEAIVTTMLWGQKDAKQNLRKSYSKSPQAVKQRTGALARSISIDRSKLGTLQGRIYSNMEYAPHVEFGHRLVRGGKFADGGEQIGYVDGKYFMKQTSDKLGAELHKNVAKSLGRRL